MPAIARRVSRRILLAAGFVLWGIFVASRFAERSIGGISAVALELAGMNWLGTLFLLFVCLLTMDIVTAFGFLFRRAAPSLRGWALLAGVLLSALAMVQGLRPPVVENYEVTLPGLPPDADGLVLVAVSDLHLGTLLDEGWLEARCGEIRAQRPDLVVLLAHAPLASRGYPPDHPPLPGNLRAWIHPERWQSALIMIK